MHPPAQICYIAPHLHRLDWLTLQDSLQISQLPPGGVLQRSLNAATGGSATHSMRIAGGTDSNDVCDNVVLVVSIPLLHVVKQLHVNVDLFSTFFFHPPHMPFSLLRSRPRWCAVC